MYAEYLALGRQIKKLNLGDLLEFGCGGGGFLKYVLDLNTSFNSVTAVDINPKSVEKARALLADVDIHFIVQEKLPLDIEADYFSTITLSNTLHHLQDKATVLAELMRLIKPAGQIIITEMMSNNLTEAEQTYCHFHALRAETDRLDGIFHDKTYSSDEIETIVVDVGLCIEKKEVLLNDKQVVLNGEEISNMETIIDELIQEAKGRSEFETLTMQAESVKRNLKQFGIKRPRQLYLETSLSVNDKILR